MKRTNFDIYARILRLETDFEAHCRLCATNIGQDPKSLYNIVRDVIAADKTLVWC